VKEVNHPDLRNKHYKREREKEKEGISIDTSEYLVHKTVRNARALRGSGPGAGPEKRNGYK